MYAYRSKTNGMQINKTFYVNKIRRKVNTKKNFQNMK